jgi:hypothetical protein
LKSLPNSTGQTPPAGPNHSGLNDRVLNLKELGNSVAEYLRRHAGGCGYTVLLIQTECREAHGRKTPPFSLVTYLYTMYGNNVYYRENNIATGGFLFR